MADISAPKLPDQPLAHHTFYLFNAVTWLGGGYRLVLITARSEGREVGRAEEMRRSGAMHDIIVECEIESETAPDSVDCDVQYIVPSDET